MISKCDRARSSFYIVVLRRLSSCLSPPLMQRPFLSNFCQPILENVLVKTFDLKCTANAWCFSKAWCPYYSAWCVADAWAINSLPSTENDEATVSCSPEYKFLRTKIFCLIKKHSNKKHVQPGSKEKIALQ